MFRIRPLLDNTSTPVNRFNSKGIAGEQSTFQTPDAPQFVDEYGTSFVLRTNPRRVDWFSGVAFELGELCFLLQRTEYGKQKIKQISNL